MTEYSEHEIRAILKPYHSQIWGAVNEGFAEWMTVSECRIASGFGPVLYPRTSANYVFDAVVRNARASFSTAPGVKVFDQVQTVKFCFEKQVIGRFKKGDDGNLGQNIKTQAVLDFLDPQATLPGLPPAAAKVEFTWGLDELQTGIDYVMVVARNGSRLLWSYEIDPPLAEGRLPVDFPTAPPDQGEFGLVIPKPLRKKASPRGE